MNTKQPERRVRHRLPTPPTRGRRAATQSAPQEADSRANLPARATGTGQRDRCTSLACRDEGEALGSGLEDVFRALRHHQLEVLDEARGEGVVLLEILFAAGPGAGR